MANGELPDRFEPRALLGVGGMGTVHRVYDRELGRELALKTVFSASHSARLKQEFRARAGLVHPNLVELHELGLGPPPWFTMEIVEGQRLDTYVLGAGAVAERTETAAPTPAGAPVRQPTVDALERDDDDAAPASAHAIRHPPVDAAERLRATMIQLVEALGVLHAAGLVHRDLKPGNVLVRADGQVKLLDFGLTSAADELETAPPELAGTRGYIAPEIWAGQPATPRSDLFALGVIIDELLPNPEAAPELARAATRLRSADPNQRPGPVELLELLGAKLRPVMVPTADLRLLGREREVELLLDALARVRSSGERVIVDIRGRSGVGKSSLIRHVAHQLALTGEVRVVRGRCTPHESGPYRPLDQIVDRLVELPDHRRQLASLDATELAALATLFPGTPALRALAHHESRRDPAALRLLGARALARWIAASSRERPMLIWLDDLQWGSLDLVPLLDALTESAPDPATRSQLLLVLSSRSEDQGAGLLARLGARDRIELELEPLPPTHAEQLVGSLVSPRPEVMTAILAYAQGNPYRLVEAAALVATQPDVEVLDPLAQRLAQLGPKRRELLDVTAIVGGPVERAVVLAAAGRTPDARLELARLEDLGWLRSTWIGESVPAVAPRHDQIWEGIVARLDEQRQTSLHRGVAEALELHRPDDAAALARHWQGAHEPVKAGGHAERAGDQSHAALAFDRAASFYDRARTLLAADDDDARLSTKRAEALHNLGDAFAAAEDFMRAAARTSASEPMTRRGLRRRAAEAWIGAHQPQRGWAEMSAVLSELHVALPKTPMAAILRALVKRMRYLIRGLPVADSQPASPEREELLDALWSATTRFSQVNHLLADPLRLDYLEAACRGGDEERLTRVLCYEATMLAYLQPAWFKPKRAALMRQIDELLLRCETPYNRAWYELALANEALLDCRFEAAAQLCDQAQARLERDCIGAHWERSLCQGYRFLSLTLAGRLTELAAAMDPYLDDAAKRGDGYAPAVCFIGDQTTRWLAADRLDQAGRWLEVVGPPPARDAAWPAEAYTSGHMSALVASSQGLLYRDQPERAWAEVEAQWPTIRAGMFLSLRLVGAQLWQLRARVALAAAVATDANAARQRRARLRQAQRALDMLRRDDAPIAAPWAELLAAGLARTRGSTDTIVRAHLERARVGFAQLDMALYELAARWALGGEPAHAAARALQDGGVVNPVALMRVLAPGLGPTSHE